MKQITEKIISQEVVQQDNPNQPTPAETHNIPYETTLRPHALDSRTYKIRCPHFDHSIFVHVARMRWGGRNLLRELFFSSRNGDHLGFISALGRTASAVFRANTDPSFLIREWKEIPAEKGPYHTIFPWLSKPVFVPSIDPSGRRTAARVERAHD